jgi:hypothetical protein
MFFNGLGSFDAAIDCAAANNGLKRRVLLRGRANFRLAPELALTIRNWTTFLTRSEWLSG